MFKRYLSFILAGAVVLGSIVLGSFALSGSEDMILMDGEGETLQSEDDGIMLLDASSMALSLENSDVNLTFSGVNSSLNGSITSLKSRLPSSPYEGELGSFTARVSGSVNSVTLAGANGISVPSNGMIHLSGNFRFIFYLLGSVSIRTGLYRVTNGVYFYQQRDYSSDSMLWLYPESIDVLFDGEVVATFPGVSSDTQSFDLMIPVSSSVSSVKFRLNYDMTINRTSNYRSGSASYVSPSYGGYRLGILGGDNGAFNVAQFVKSSVTYEFSPLTIEDYLAQILGKLDDLNSAAGTPSAMDKFENDYLGNEHISGQLDKAEQFISPNNPGLPNGGDVGGFAEQIQNGMGFNGSSFDSEKFQQATDAFKVDSTSTGEGGMWWFFSQDVADSLAHDDAATVSDDDGQSLQDAWVEQIKRRWGNW